ncbi:hypothetical protein AZE42_13484, partial [Rhizopogon vesiculosus]
MWSVDDKVV